MKQVRLNRAEVWIVDHALPIFGVVALAIVGGAVGIAVVFLQAREAGDQVNVLKPQVMRVNKAICDKQSLGHPQRAERCAERIRVGLVNCRHSQPCRAALLAAITYPPPARPGALLGTTAPSSKGVVSQKPSHSGHQQPGPGSQPGPSAPSPNPPASSPAPGKPGNGPPVETPGKGPPASPGGGSASGSNVEVCVDPLNTCVGVGAGAKGLLP